jgi:phage terminase large subunit
MKVNHAIYDPLVNGKHKTVVHQGGSSSGKTYGILQYLFQIGAQNPSEVITVVGQDIPNLRVGAYRDAQNILSGDEVLSKWWPNELHNKSNRTFRCVNGTVMEFNSYSDEQDAKSGKRNRLFINEANGVTYEIYEQLRIRTTEQVIIDFNPSASFWAHDRLFGDPDVNWVVSTFRDNAFINDSVRSAILSYEPTPENIKRGTANEYRWKVYGLGEVGRLEGLVFPDFKVTSEFPSEYKWRTFGMDFGYTNDPTTLIEIRYAHGNLYWKQHIYETGLTNPDISKRLAEIGHETNELIIADSAEPKSIEELRRMGWHVRPAVKGSDSIMNGIDSMKRYPIYIHSGSKQLIEEFGSYTWKKDKNGNALNVPIDAFNHGIDAGRYAVSMKINKPAKSLEIFFA